MWNIRYKTIQSRKPVRQWPCEIPIQGRPQDVYQVIWEFIPKQDYLLAAIGVVLIILAGIMTAEGITTARRPCGASL